jgi:ABC-type amino acid transport substrate-binding protein
MAAELAAFLGAEAELIPLDVDDYVKAIEEQRADIVIAGLSRTLTRGKKIWFSIPYITITPGVLTRKNALPQTSFGDKFEQPPFKTLWDLKRVHRFEFAVKKGSAYQEILTEHFPKMPVKLINENDEGIALLAKGDVSGFIHDSLYLQYIYERDIKLRSSHVLLQGGDYSESICVGLPKGDVKLKIEVDLFIEEVNRLGKMQQWIRDNS